MNERLSNNNNKLCNMNKKLRSVNHKLRNMNKKLRIVNDKLRVMNYKMRGRNDKLRVMNDKSYFWNSVTQFWVYDSFSTLCSVLVSHFLIRDNILIMICYVISFNRHNIQKRLTNLMISSSNFKKTSYRCLLQILTSTSIIFYTILLFQHLHQH